MPMVIYRSLISFTKRSDFGLSFLLGSRQLYTTIEGHLVVANGALVRQEGGVVEAQPTHTLWWFGIGVSVLLPFVRLAL